MHEEEMRHKDIQLSTMRSYLLKKINIAQRIEKIRGNKKNIVVLTEEDWEEIKMFVDNVEGNFISRLKKRFPKLSDEDITLLFHKAYNEDKDLALKCLFYLRDIRGGKLFA